MLSVQDTGSWIPPGGLTAALRVSSALDFLGRESQLNPQLLEGSRVKSSEKTPDDQGSDSTHILVRSALSHRNSIFLPASILRSWLVTAHGENDTVPRTEISCLIFS